jgi:hypothetical protein
MKLNFFILLNSGVFAHGPVCVRVFLRVFFAIHIVHVRVDRLFYMMHRRLVDVGVFGPSKFPIKEIRIFESNLII